MTTLYIFIITLNDSSQMYSTASKTHFCYHFVEMFSVHETSMHDIKCLSAKSLKEDEYFTKKEGNEKLEIKRNHKPRN